MIKSHLLLAELSGCVVTTSQTQSSPPGQNNSNVHSDLYRGGNEKPFSPAGSEGDGLWSCSGVILDRGTGIVICQAAVFFPFLKERDRPFSSSDHTVLSADNFPSDLLIQVECWSKPKIDAEQETHFNHQVLDQRSGLGLVPVSKPQSQRTQHTAELLMLLPCPEFQLAFSRLFRKEDSWVFSSEEEKEYGEFQKDLEYLHWFAVLKLQSPLRQAKSRMDIMKSSGLVKGSAVFACSSPFGSFYPDIFLNTVSKGVLSNTAGDGNVVMLTDARCLPGSEGGGVFLFENGRLHLVGIIVTPLCWKANEWVGLTLACSISHIIDNIIKALGKADIPMKKELAALEMGHCIVDKPKRGARPLEHLMAVAVLVDSGQSWGSGVLLKPKLVLTCRHVVRDSSKVSVKIQNDKMTSGDHYAFKRFHAVRGNVVFSTHESSPFDIAVIQLEEDIPGIPEPVLASGYCTGEDVCIVGFGALGERSGPSVTSGVLSSVISVGDVPVMLQTSCAVHGGSSGGPLFAVQSGELLGIVASNTRDNSTGATYPHLNFSIPVTILQAALDRYIEFGDLRSLGELNKAGLAVRDVWRLQRSPENVFQSKL
ncbi:PREDICTED: peroxisomal leader peptide-processing protease isoform X1 [Nanorana parkeri]|uniref:peroxisomal leader peptide-processing protease isoform X1 n=1 Tax=Nanorana parkeri TaxID=125878 RepID=UPI000854A9C3|nr:PREDICTED: peroxisomal leader peptide-processing protease isoform X1 [Nanorana parkeri]XP_018418423.1 PREDICTED: peroxisomal leader peptide-processing protease isoform X2 [Nanorana parkeri]XP_018418424.1 PREDICTED: peroxisomal leader peptide-processing protease isoform X1 [Nanorana parkeri]XP_018418425.1 PREDICTED: peroxisomal leader peptide-processing protease isoform X1 [Nanorana parkeri]